MGGLFANLAGALNSSVLALHAEPVTYRDALGGVAFIQAIYVHSDENGAVERFEAREVDFPQLPKKGDTLTRADGSVFNIVVATRVDGGWLWLQNRLLSR